MIDADALQDDFLDWFNGYITLDKYAEDREITTGQARRLIELGREIHEDNVATE